MVLLELALGLIALLWLGALVQTLRSVARVPRLEMIEFELETWPSLSVISPACDEAAGLEPALRATLASDYPSLELVAVDDRSTDGTGAIIDRLAVEDARVVPVHVTALPEGWLGKVHALEQGRRAARGDWLLFADADTELAPGALRRAIHHAVRGELDLLTAYPEVTSRSRLAGSVFAAAPILAQLSMPTWKVNVPESEAYAGLGAFILVRRAFLDTTPGLEWLRLDVADDMALGLLVKSHGGRLGVVNGRGLVQIEFYASGAEMMRRMQKNFWAIMARFSVARGVGQAAFLLALGLAPLLALAPSASPLARSLAGLGLAELVLAAGLFNRWVGRPVVEALLAPLGLLFTAFMVLRAVGIGARIGGVEWRGVRYDSALLLPMQRVKL